MEHERIAGEAMPGSPRSHDLDERTGFQCRFPRWLAQHRRGAID